MNDMEIAQDEALAVGLAIQGVRHCLSVCGLMTPAIQDAVIAEGFVDLLSFAELHDKDIHEMVKSINTNPMPPPFQVQRAPVRGGGGRGRGRGRGHVQPPLVPPDDEQQQIIVPVIPEAVKITRRSARRLCGLVHWVKDRMRRGVQIDPYLFDEAALIDALQEDEGEDLADTVDVDLPDKFTPDKWVQWEIEFTNNLGTKRGIRGILLSYVI
jgi:hypothetical protein